MPSLPAPPGAARAAPTLEGEIARVAQQLEAERARVAAAKGAMKPEEWAEARAGATKSLYNLLERRAVLARMRAFPGRTYLEQATIVGVESGGTVRPTSAISKTGRGRIADILEIKGTKATLDDLKSPSTQVGSIKGGMRQNIDIEAVFRPSSEIAGQHQIEQDVIAEARRTGGKVIIEGRDPLTGAAVRRSFDPNDISSRVTDYTSLGSN